MALNFLMHIKHNIQDDILVLDVRNMEECANNNIKYLANKKLIEIIFLPLWQIISEEEFFMEKILSMFNKINQIKKQAHIYCLCEAGVRSLVACNFLDNLKNKHHWHNCTFKNIEGGIAAIGKNIASFNLN